MTESAAPKRLTVHDAENERTECLEMARHAIIPPHRIMLKHMAETWEDRQRPDVE